VKKQRRGSEKHISGSRTTIVKRRIDSQSKWYSRRSFLSVVLENFHDNSKVYFCALSFYYTLNLIHKYICIFWHTLYLSNKFNLYFSRNKHFFKIVTNFCYLLPSAVSMSISLFLPFEHSRSFYLFFSHIVLLLYNWKF